MIESTIQDPYGLSEHIGAVIALVTILFGVCTTLIITVSTLFWKTFNKEQEGRFKSVEDKIGSAILDARSDLEGVRNMIDDVRKIAFKTIEDNANEHKEFAKLLTKHDVVYQKWLRKRDIATFQEGEEET